MEFSYSQLKQKDVINIHDGSNLGKVCDLAFTFPENNVTGITVTGCKGFRLTKQDLFIPVYAIVRIGEDAVLVKLEEHGQCPPKKGPPENCPPPKRPPNNCPPKRPPQNCPPNNCPPHDRRSYDEYE